MRVKILASLLLLATLTACDAARPLHAIREKGDYNLEVERYDEARAEYREYLVRKPEDIEVRYRYAKALMGAGETSLAREQFSLLVDLAPTDDRFIDGHVDSLYAAGENADLAAFLARMCTQRGSVRDWIRQADLQRKTGDLDGARASLLTAAKFDGGRSTLPWIAQADLFASIGDKASERGAIANALFISPGNPELSERYRKLGGIPGPTAGVRPAEYAEPMKK